MMQRPWPDALDWSAIAVFLAVVVGIPTVGYWLLVIDIRRYLRSLRRALVCVASLLPRATPDWARNRTPGCLRGLQLELPCGLEDCKQAYRRLAKELHPDRGGDRRRFLRLQRDFEASVAFLSACQTVDPTSDEAGGNGPVDPPNGK